MWHMWVMWHRNPVKEQHIDSINKPMDLKFHRIILDKWFHDFAVYQTIADFFVFPSGHMTQKRGQISKTVLS